MHSTRPAESRRPACRRSIACTVREVPTRVGNARRCRDDDPWRGEVHRWDVLGEDLLHLVKQSLPLRIVRSRHLRFHELVNARFPRGRRRGLSKLGFQKMKSRPTQPEVQVRPWIGITRAEAQIHRVEVHVRHAVDEGSELQRHDINGQSEDTKILCNDSSRTLSDGVPSLGQQREPRRFSVRAVKTPVC